MAIHKRGGESSRGSIGQRVGMIGLDFLYQGIRGFRNSFMKETWECGRSQGLGRGGSRITSRFQGPQRHHTLCTMLEGRGSTAATKPLGIVC